MLPPPHYLVPKNLRNSNNSNNFSSDIGKQLLFANNRNRDGWAVLCLSQNGACIDLFENHSENSWKPDPSNDTTVNPLFSHWPIRLICHTSAPVRALDPDSVQYKRSSKWILIYRNLDTKDCLHCKWIPVQEPLLRGGGAGARGSGGQAGRLASRHQVTTHVSSIFFSSES